MSRRILPRGVRKVLRECAIDMVRTLASAAPGPARSGRLRDLAERVELRGSWSPEQEQAITAAAQVELARRSRP